MTFHILDVIMYFVLEALVWKLIPNDFKEEIGVFVGIFILFIYTILYIIVFAVFDNNWIDIFKGIGSAFSGPSPKIKW